MYFDRETFWTHKDLDDFLIALKRNDRVSVQWIWRPHFLPGFTAAQFGAEKNYSDEQFRNAASNLSSPAQGLNRPELISRILGKRFNTDSILPSVGYLKSVLTEQNIPTEPAVESQVSNILTSMPFLMKRFQALSSWNRLELIELAVGPLFPSTVLNFVRIYSS